jgi:hypothetical protein
MEHDDLEHDDSPHSRLFPSHRVQASDHAQPLQVSAAGGRAVA